MWCLVCEKQDTECLCILDDSRTEERYNEGLGLLRVSFKLEDLIGCDADKGENKQK